MLADLLKKYDDSAAACSPLMPGGRSLSQDPIFAKARIDVNRMISLLSAVAEHDQNARTRVEVLKDHLLERFGI